MKQAIRWFFIASITTLFSMSCSDSNPTMSLGIKNGKLEECPSSPNCVSTQTQDPERAMPPLPISRDMESSRQIILSIVDSMKRSKIITNDSDYLHIEFRSAIFRFIDDVEFLFDGRKNIIHFRSASRTGYSDLGVNRKRMAEISKRYLAESN